MLTTSVILLCLIQSHLTFVLQSDKLHALSERSDQDIIDAKADSLINSLQIIQENLDNILKELNGKIKELDEQDVKLKGETESLKEEKEKQSNDIKSLEKTIGTIDEKQSEIKNTIESLERRQQATEDASQAQSDKITLINIEIQDKLNGEVNGLKKSLESLQMLLGTQQNEISSLKEENVKQDGTIKKLENLIEATKSEIAENQNEINNDLEQLNGAIGYLNDTTKIQSDKQDETSNRIDEITNDINEIEDKNKELKKSIDILYNCGKSGQELAKAMEADTRVVRGKDWQWGNQDSHGEGTVLSVHVGWVEVKWDNGNVHNYRMGDDGRYELNLAACKRG